MNLIVIYIFIILYSLLSLATPSINIGIPLRFEDLLLVLFIIKYFKQIINIYNIYRVPITIYLIYTIIGLFSFYLSVFNGYPGDLSDINTILMNIKIILTFIVGCYLGSLLEFKKYLIYLNLGLIVSSIVSIIQYYDLLGLGQKIYLFYGKEERITYGITRTIGTIGNPNYAAYFSIISVINILFTKNNILKYLLLVISIFGVILTFSRTGIIALIFILLLYFILLKKIKTLLIFIFLFFQLVVFNFEILFEDTRLLQQMEKDDGFDISLGGRSNLIWSEKLVQFYENPLFGVGTMKTNTSNTIFSTIIFDNSFLYLLVTSGLLGFSVYFLYYFSVFKKIFKNNIITNRNILILYSFVTVIFFITSDLIKNIQYSSFIILIYGMLYSNSKKIFLNENINNNTML